MRRSERLHQYTMRRSNHSLMRRVLAEGIDTDLYLGHGSFSVVYATGRDTVAKFTVDPAVVQFCEEAQLFYSDNPLFPRVFDVARLGDIRGLNGEDLTLYRIDCERLQPIKREKGSIPWLRSLRARRALTSSRIWCCEKPFRQEETELLAKRISRVTNTCRDHAEDFINLVRAQICSGAAFDMHCGNIMRRENGEVVMNDPLCTKDKSVWGAVRKYTGDFDLWPA